MEPVPSQSLANFEQKQEYPMSNRAIIPTSDLNGKRDKRIILGMRKANDPHAWVVEGGKE